MSCFGKIVFQPKKYLKWAELFKDGKMFSRQATKTYKGTKFTSNEEVTNTVSYWLKSQCKQFYKEGIQKLIH